MLESLNYSFRNPKNKIWVIYRITQLRNYKKNHGVLRGPQLGKQRWRPRLGILRVKSNLGLVWLEAGDQLVLLIILPNTALNFLFVCRDPSSVGMSDNFGVFGRKAFCCVCVRVGPLTLPFSLLKCFCLSSFLACICSASIPAKHIMLFVPRLSVKPIACMSVMLIFNIPHFQVPDFCCSQSTIQFKCPLQDGILSSGS